MSATQTIAGGAGLAAVMQAAWLAIAPAPPPIQIHSLTYDAGYIVQDRTVNQSTWVAEWKAEIVENGSGETVPNCSGSGFWAYPGGTIAPRISLGEWVGNENCTLAPGAYYPRATYWDGEHKVVYRGDVFEVTK
jgi:hypothetical protein